VVVSRYRMRQKLATKMSTEFSQRFLQVDHKEVAIDIDRSQQYFAAYGPRPADDVPYSSF